MGKRKQSTSSKKQVKRETESETSQSEQDSSDDFQEEVPLKTRKAAGKYRARLRVIEIANYKWLQFLPDCFFLYDETIS